MKKNGRKTGRRQFNRYFPLYGLIGPTFIFLIIFNYYPAFLAVLRSFFEWDIGGKSDFIGLANFKELFQDPVFLKSMLNMSKLLIFIIIVNMTIPLIVAEMIYAVKSKWNYFLRILFVIPMLIPPVVIWVLWKYIYSDAGILTAFLEAIGKPEWIYGWLSHPKTALTAIAFVGFPFAIGFNILVYYAGLNNIPTSLMESAMIDGAKFWHIFFKIHLPLILSQVKLLFVLTIISVLQGFEIVYVLTGDGGPGYETMLPGLYMFFSGFTYNRMGYACSIGVVLFIMMLIFTILSNKFFKTEQEFQAK